MNRIKDRRHAFRLGATACATAAGLAAAVSPAVAHDGPGPRGGESVFVASLNGANEVPAPGGPAVGDKNGSALEFVRVRGNQVSFAVTFRGIGRPTALHIHEGGRGSNGAVKVPLISKKTAGKGRTATGSVTVGDRAFLQRFTSDPGAFYANLHTAAFPGGAVRGQFHKVTQEFDFDAALSNFQASVIRGAQVYECTRQPGGRYAFAQRDVRALLARGIVHSFVRPNSGTPQWVAPDRSAVTGELISKTPNGDSNIPELDLRATPSGRAQGLFARTTEILRLNTVGGVAPAGSCDPYEKPVAAVPYRADYVFLNG
ncbi:CHRD domain-containing protein [Streptomyces sp. 8N706]|uniref:CHRD domain-containing protein n=1 Tax=Streptomyces sp. 8N706 TaxID=3457416 RepID=UPI003FD5F036